MPVRIVGQDRSFLLQNNQRIGQKALNTVASGQQFLEASNQVLNTASESMQRSIASAQQSQAVIAQAAAQRASQPSSLSQVFGSVAETLQGITESKEKQKQAVLEQQREVQLAEAQREMLQLASDAPKRYINDGGETYKGDIHRVVSKYPMLRPEDTTDLFKIGFGAATEQEKVIATQAREGLSKMLESATSQAKANLTIALGGKFARLERVRDDGERATIINDINGYLTNWQKNNPQIPAIEQYQIVAYIAEQTAKSTMASDVAKQAAQDYADNLNGFIYTDYAESLEKFGDNPALLQADLRTKAALRGLPYGDVEQITDPNYPLQVARDTMQLNSQLEELTRQGVINQVNTQPIDQDLSNSLAAMMIADPSLRTVIENDPVASKLNPNIRAMELSDAFYRQREKEAKLTGDVQALIRQKETFESQTLGTLVSVMRGEVKPDKAANTINSIRDLLVGQTASRMLSEKDAENIEQQLNALSGIVSQGSTVKPEDVEKFNELQAQWVQARNNISRTYAAQIRAMQQELNGEDAAMLRAAGLLGFDPKDKDAVAQFRSLYDQRYKLEQEKINQARGTPAPQGVQGNFNGGSSPRVDVKYATGTSTLGETITLPFRHDAKNIVIGDGFSLTAGDPRHGRDRPHKGLDIAAPAGTPIISLVDGQVVGGNFNPANDGGGFGVYVDIKGDDGYVHRFAHMQGSYFKTGDRVIAGQPVGKVGSTGRSTGPHLHYEMLNEGGHQVDIEIMLQHFKPQARQVRSDNTQQYNQMPDVGGTFKESEVPPSIGMPPNAVPLLGGGYILDGRVVFPETQQQQPAESYTNAVPFRQSAVPVEAKPTKGTSNNFGYNLLANDQKLREKLHDVAKRLGVDPMWIADIIQYESGWRTNTNDENPIGCQGYIQWCPRSGNSGVTWSPGRETTAQIAKMSPLEQIELIYDYFAPVKHRLKSVMHADVYVFGGEKLLKRLENEGLSEGVLNTSDGYVTVRDRMNGLGKHVGRRYNGGSSERRERAARIVHDTQVAGCTSCNQFSQANTFVPHQGIA